jgi:type IV pilus assembly protein PilA
MRRIFGSLMRNIFSGLTPRKHGAQLAGTVLVALGIAFVANAAMPRALHARINKTKAYVATMKADLRNLVTAQEDYFSDSVRYTASIADLIPASYSFSTGVELVSLSAHGAGFSARVRYPGGTERECWIAVGPLPDGTANLNDGEPICDLPPIDKGRIYLAVAYAALLLFALGVRLARGGITLPPAGVPFFAGFLFLAAVHPFWTGYRTESYSCFDTLGPEWLSVWLAGIIALWMTTRGYQDPNPPRPA